MLLDGDRRLQERAASWPECRTCAELTAEGLNDAAARQGIDFATSVLYDRVMYAEEHRPFIRKLERLHQASVMTPMLNAMVVIVPGAFYREFPHTGADGRVLREEATRFGCRSELIPLPSFGSVRDNARLICDWLTTCQEENLILVSLSRGGADVKIALSQPEGAYAFRNVVVWLNLCGLVYGSPLVNWFLARPLRTSWLRMLCWLRRWEFTALAELASGPGTLLDDELRLPAHVQLISVIGFPLRRHLTNGLARRSFGRLEPLGPNDGASLLLTTVRRVPGLLYPVWGADHYMRPAGSDVRAIAARILHYLNDEWNQHTPQLAGIREAT